MLIDAVKYKTKKYMVIYNPSSGRELAGNRIFNAAKIAIEKRDLEITFFATKKKDDAMEKAMEACSEEYDMIIACGGDGTIHEVVDGIMKSEKKTKLGILPAGTVNDFAEQLHLPTTSQEFAQMLLNEKFETIDVGRIENTYFTNVVCGGAFTDIAHTVNTDSKTFFGKYAYYFQAAVDIPGQLDKSYKIKYTLDDKESYIDTFLFIISNTTGAGGFKYLSPNAKYDDGLLDIVVFEKSSPADLFQIFTKLFNGNHINHPKVHYLQAKDLKIECEEELIIDVDGELWGKAPIELRSIHNVLEILVP